MNDEWLMRIHDADLLERGERVFGAEFAAMSERVRAVTAITTRLNGLPFEFESGKRELLGQILGRPLPKSATVYPPFYTDHGLNLELGERVLINQGCTFLDYAGIRLGDGVMVGPRVTFITMGHPVDPEERRHFLTGAPIDVAENVWIGAGATILPSGRPGDCACRTAREGAQSPGLQAACGARRGAPWRRGPRAPA